MDVMRRRGRKLLAPSADCRCAQLVDTQRADDIAGCGQRIVTGHPRDAEVGELRHDSVVARLGYEDVAREVQDLYLDGKKEEAAAALPGELIDKVSLCGPADRIKDRLAAYRDAGVGTMIVTPMSFVPEERVKMVRQLAELL